MSSGYEATSHGAICRAPRTFLAMYKDTLVKGIPTAHSGKSIANPELPKPR
jgi:hypothetical protein